MRLRWWRATVVCQQWVELVTDYLDGALPRRIVAAIDRHLADCEHCHEYLDQMRATVRITGTLRDEELPDELLDALQAAFEEVQRGNS